MNGANATNLGSRILFFRAGSTRWFTYLKVYRCHAHITGLLYTAVLLQHSMLDLHTAVALHLSELLLLMSLTHNHKVAAPDDSIQHTLTTVPARARHSGAAAVRGTRTSLRAYCCTRVLGTNEGDFSSRIYLPSATYFNLVNT